jgi:prephenate dehydratase
MKNAESKTIKRVAIQGGYGSFHETAALSYYKDNAEVVPCVTFEDVFFAIHSNRADCGLIAIENTVAGSLLHNYTLLRDSKLRVTGEILLRVRQNLMALPGQSIEELTEVHSHPIAIAQTREFFNQYPHIKLIETDDTALSAKMISDEKRVGIGAIASQLAADLFGLEILAKGIETNKRNFTRFLVIEPDDYMLNPNDRMSFDKASLCFSLPHETGSLAKVLSVLAFYSVNLSKIQSLPILGKEWQYFFYVDVTFDDLLRYTQSLDAIRPLTINLEILGEYESAQSIVQSHNSSPAQSTAKN